MSDLQSFKVITTTLVIQLK